MPKNYEIFNAQDYLKTPKDIAEYINAVMEEGDDALFLSALGDVVKASGNISALSRKTGVSRETLYSAFGADGNPRFSTLFSILGSFGLEFAVRTKLSKDDDATHNEDHHSPHPA